MTFKCNSYFLQSTEHFDIWMTRLRRNPVCDRTCKVAITLNQISGSMLTPDKVLNSLIHRSPFCVNIYTSYKL